MAPILELQDVHTHFPIRNAWGRRTGWLRAVDGVSLSVARGEVLGIVGESGCGKTTIGKTIAGIHTPAAGRILFEGHDISRCRRARAARSARVCSIAIRIRAPRWIRIGASAARWRSRW